MAGWCCARCTSSIPGDGEEKAIMDLSDGIKFKSKEEPIDLEQQKKEKEEQKRKDAEARKKAEKEAKEKKEREAKEAAKKKAAEAERQRLEKERKEKEERAARLGDLAKPGAKLQILLDNGWVDAALEDYKQICDHVNGGNKTFPIQSRGAMYFIDW
eukprot:CAMPEP_0169112702 /NCGR_PEP_ID=MMETSP1015-20121227/27782_1 /TAXON_ID=342587 /ORGANISM="Karlodinium micrum, Strain CCMP2283" /LENGTH=156 /DNA_ID=CAMNT_0009174769 /DNA_START=46 /DNA_END=513 /DNA_ORIENTATION=+